jgi:hypothetical protein
MGLGARKPADHGAHRLAQIKALPFGRGSKLGQSDPAERAIFLQPLRVRVALDVDPGSEGGRGPEVLRLLMPKRVPNRRSLGLYL